MPLPAEKVEFRALQNAPVEADPKAVAGAPNPVFDSAGFLTNSVLNGGSIFIPPDSHAAVGPTHVVTAVNTTLQFHLKNGTVTNAIGLRTFFQNAGMTVATATFDPKVLFDPYSNRFLVVTLEQVGFGTAATTDDASRLFIAVSDDSDPTGNWYATVIDSRVDTTGAGGFAWFDYPGFSVDEEAIYLNGNMFSFAAGAYSGVRLWIISKGHGTGGFYDGAPATVTAPIDPYTVPGSLATTTQPSRMYGAFPAIEGPVFVSYSGLTDGVDEYIQTLRIQNPLSASPTFIHNFTLIGNIDTASGALVDAPQPGTAVRLESNDRRALDSLWRGNGLWVVASTNPPVGHPENGQTTAYWTRLDTSDLDAIVQADGGHIGGEGIAPGTFTSFPSIAVNSAGSAAIGFSASSPTTFGGAYVATRRASDPAGVTSAPVAIKSGVDFYIRDFSTTPGAQNRWGDYSATAVDLQDQCFWVFNEWADTRGTNLGGGLADEDGRWSTAAGRVCACEGDESSGDVDLDGICQNIDVCATDPSNTCAGPVTNLSISNSDGVTSANAGGTVTYTIVARATSTNAANSVTGARVRDTFVAPLSGCTWTCAAQNGATCSASGSGDIDDVVNLPAGAVQGIATYTAVCGVSPFAAGQLVNTAALIYGHDANYGNNTATDTDAIVERADVRVTVTDGVSSVDAGGTLNYVIAATNLGTGSASNVTISDAFPASLACTWTCTPGAGASCDAGPLVGNVQDTISLASGATATYNASCVVAAAAAGTTLTNTASVTYANDPTAANNTATDSDTSVVPSSNPTGAGIATPASIAVTESSRLTVTVSPGISPPSTGLSVQVDLSSVGGSASQAMRDDGQQGDQVVSDNVFTYDAIVPFGTSAGAKSLIATVSDAQGRSSSANVALDVQATVAPTAIANATPTSLAVTESTLLTVEVTPGSAPAGAITGVSADLTSIGGSATQSFVNDGTGGDASGADNIWSYTANVPLATAPGNKSFTASVSDAQSRTATANIALEVLTPTAPAAVGTAAPSTVSATQSTVLTVSVTPGTNPASSGVEVFGDLRSIGGSATTAFLDDGQGADVTQDDGTYTFEAMVDLGTTAGAKSLAVTVGDDQDREVATAIALTVFAPTSISGSGSASPSNVLADGDVVLTYSVTPGTNPASSDVEVAVDLTSIGGADAVAMLDDGVAPDAQPGDLVFTVAATVDEATSTGVKVLPVSVGDDQNRTFGGAIALNVIEAGDPVAAGVAIPADAAPGETATLIVTVTPGTNPGSTGITVTADLSSIGGSATQSFRDDGDGGDQTAGDNVFTYFATVSGATAPGEKVMVATVTDAQARSAVANLTLEIGGEPTGLLIDGFENP